jgi:hypothetical protein
MNTPPTEEQCQDIVVELKSGTLVVCSNRACDLHKGAASHGVVLASSLLQQEVATISGLVDGHPALVTSYRSELSGIVAALYLVYRLCQFYNITTGTMKFYCDNKGALSNAFKPIKAGITPYFDADHDLIEVAQSMLQLIPVLIATEWVKGHYSGNNREYKHDLNDSADRLAGDYQRCQYPHRTIRQPVAPPDYRIRLLHDMSVMTSKVASTLAVSLHDTPIVAHILRKTGWTQLIFERVHWDAHERAFCQLPRYSQHSMAKLIHSLANTNRQNNLYYEDSSLCPICHEAEETMRHVLTCSHLASQHPDKEMTTLIKVLQTAHTPQQIIETLQLDSTGGGVIPFLPKPNLLLQAPS